VILPKCDVIFDQVVDEIFNFLGFGKAFWPSVMRVVAGFKVSERQLNVPEPG